MINPILVVFALAAFVVIYALNRKGRVKADFRFLGTAFPLEVEDKQAHAAHSPVRSPSRTRTRQLLTGAD